MNARRLSEVSRAQERATVPAAASKDERELERYLAALKAGAK